MEYKIKRTEYKNEFREYFEFQAINNNGKEISGASANIGRYKDYKDVWSQWQINYSTCGAMTYKEKVPYVAVINKAMEELKTKEV